ncbi:Endonuclease/exonuclease/phosphatase [Syncephalis fuscata]|nr:Endonuclease/exonuclease/phosphatase [Syncephalis fuscata]
MALSFWTPWWRAVNGRPSSSSPPRRSQRRHHPFGLASWRRTLAKPRTPMIEGPATPTPAAPIPDPCLCPPEERHHTSHSHNHPQSHKNDANPPIVPAKSRVRRKGWKTWTRDTTGQLVRRISHQAKSGVKLGNSKHRKQRSTNSPSSPSLSPLLTPTSPSPPLSPLPLPPPLSNDINIDDDHQTNDSGCGKSLPDEVCCPFQGTPKRKELIVYLEFPFKDTTPNCDNNNSTDRPSKSTLEEDRDVDIPRMFSRWKDAFWGDAFWRRLESIFTSPHGARDLTGAERRLSQIPPDPATLPDRHGLKVFIGTWNMNGREPPVALSPFLPHNRDGQQAPEDTPNNHLLSMSSAPPYHLLVIGTQECLSTAANAVFFSPEYEAWEHRLSNWFGSEYFLIGSQGMGALHLAVFVWHRCWHWIRAVESAEVATGMGGMIGNKGAVGISVLFGETSLLFINSHLAAHAERISQRNQDYARIEKEMQLRSYELKDDPKDASGNWRVSDQFDYTFWFGDLNYRTTATRAQADTWLCANQHKRLLARDQLIRERTAQRVFHNYDEAQITFPPTYKFDVPPSTAGKNGWRRAFTLDTASLRSLRIRASSISSVRSGNNGSSGNNGTEESSDAESVQSFATVRIEASIVDRPASGRASAIIPPPVPFIPRYDTSQKQRPSRRPRSETNLSSLLNSSIKSSSHHHHRILNKKSSAIMFNKQRPCGDQRSGLPMTATSVRCLSYNAVMQMLGSDHRPVTGVYRIPFYWAETPLRDPMSPISPSKSDEPTETIIESSKNLGLNPSMTNMNLSSNELYHSSSITVASATLLSPPTNGSVTSVKESKRNGGDGNDGRLRVPANVVADRTERLRNRQRRELQARTLLKSPPSRDSFISQRRKTPVPSIIG